MVRELTEKNLIYQLRQYKVKRRVQFFPETESTNTVAKKLCNEGKGAAGSGGRFARRRARAFTLRRFMSCTATKKIWI